MKTLNIAIATLATALFTTTSANAVNPYPTDAFEGITEQSLQLESWMFATDTIAEESLEVEPWMLEAEDSTAEQEIAIEDWMFSSNTNEEPALELESWMF